jgi:hypothetical protein
MDVEGSSYGLILDTIQTLVWRDWGKPQKTSVRIARRKDRMMQLCSETFYWSLAIISSLLHYIIIC